MTRTWAMQELDLIILKKLYDSKALRGKTIAKLFTPEKENRGYDRLHALMKKELVEGINYCVVENSGSAEKPEGKKVKKATLYYLTQDGVEVVKRMRDIKVDGTERTMKPDEGQLMPLYYSSLLMEYVPLEFKNAKEFKINNKIPNFVTLDLICENWQIIVERKQSAQYRRKVLQYVKGLMDNPVCGDFMIICPTETKRLMSIKAWREDYGPNAYFMTKDNYSGITKLLTYSTLAEIIQIIEDNKGLVEKLPKPEDGFTYTVNGERCVIVDLVGFPARPLRHLAGTITESHKAHVGVENINDLKIIARYFPEILRPGFEFFTLDGVTGTSEAIKMLYGGKE